MTSGLPNGSDPVRLVSQTLQDPLADYPASHIRDWLRFLVEQFPLLTFQPHAYRNLHSSDLPTAYPLRLIIQSILQDEGLSTEGEWLAPLPAIVDRRRCAMGGRADNLGPHHLGDLTPGYTQFLPSRVADLASWSRTRSTP